MLIGKAFHRRGPATPNARSPRHVRVRGTKHVTASDDRIDGDRQRQQVDSRPSSTAGLEPMQRFEHLSTDVYAYCVLPVHLNNEILRFCTGLFEIFNQNNSICKVEITHVKLYRKLIYAESMTS